MVNMTRCLLFWHLLLHDMWKCQVFSQQQGWIITPENRPKASILYLSHSRVKYPNFWRGGGIQRFDPVFQKIVSVGFLGKRNSNLTVSNLSE
ncbi:hypothetical protein CEXT_255481 [Caerostris extrusa]|uniref:Secreted protein n=1 Tax=Caerostris extrusa TaxID=172846 RepID=A0AAV4VLH9_CAEEX|nr:hypothetical protein CEXT_255481 [Caerostris extrusa]